MCRSTARLFEQSRAGPYRKYNCSTGGDVMHGPDGPDANRK